MRVLVVEDERKVARALREGLEAEHYDVRVASSGEEGFFLVNNETFDCVVLDLMLPRMSGLELCRKLRTEGDQVPILILTARSEEADRVLGLDFPLGVRFQHQLQFNQIGPHLLGEP